MLMFLNAKTLRIQIIMVILATMGCSVKESRPTYGILENNVPTDSIRIEWNIDGGLVNINNIEKSLSPESKATFSRSLGWYGTEGQHSLEKLNGLTAKQLVDVVNCLKSKPKKGMQCFVL